MPQTTLIWVPAGNGFELALDGPVLRCRDDRGRPVDPLPPQVRETRLYPAWALVRHPADAETALATAARLERAAGDRPSDAAATYDLLARDLPPAHLPAFFDHAGRALVAAGDAKRAAVLFGRAREAEREHGVPSDDAVWLAAHLEFAEAGALSAKALTPFVAGLRERFPAGEALDALIEVAVRRGRAGQPPWAQFPRQLSALAKAAGRDETAEQRRAIDALLATSAARHAPAALWKAWRPTLVKVARDSPQTRGRLLDLFPTPEGIDGWWLDVLDDCGALDALTGDGDPGSEPLDGRAGWLSRTVQHPLTNATMQRRPSRVIGERPRPLLDLIPRMSARLAGDGVAVRLDGTDHWAREIDVRVLETCLANGVPVADPGPGASLGVTRWLRHREPGEDLPATVADPVFGPLLRGVAASFRDPVELWKVPALRPFVTSPEGERLTGPEAVPPHPLDDLAVIDALNGLIGPGLDRPGLIREVQLDDARARDLAGTARADALRAGAGRLNGLVGRVGGLALRAVAAATRDERRARLLAVLEVWAGTLFADREAAPLTWGDAAQLRALLELVRDRGPAPFDPEAASLLARRTGMSRPAAALLLVGVLGVRLYRPPFLDDGERAVLGLTAAEADDARTELDRALTMDQGLDLWAGALPADPAGLWEPGGQRDLAERLAERWVALVGRRVAVPEETVAAATSALELGGHGVTAAVMCAALAEPGTLPLLTTNVDTWLDQHSWLPGRPPQVRVTSAGDGHHWYGALLDDVVAAARWAYAELPGGDPVRAGVPEVLALLRERLGHPGLLVTAGLADFGFASLDALRSRFGSAPYRGPGPIEIATVDDGLTVAAETAHSPRLFFRPALFLRDDRSRHLLDTLGTPDGLVASIQWLLGEECGAMMERIRSRTLPDRACESDPRASVPALVDEVAAHHGLETGPAALYLQLLALPGPTDRNVRAWNRWNPARHKKAVEELSARGLVVVEKRSRAGRTAFLPGGWQPAGKPWLPMESWKGDPPLAEGRAPGSCWPRRPLPDLFTAAWRRVLEGDPPR
ncbi:hypothetical protein [Spirillospora sp. CA-294931]|uniref:hypothetical protein n=1 Tax=Spirillospora sp. CA-294931 TaxID=3240042 RepID=UPI003D90AB02